MARRSQQLVRYELALVLLVLVACPAAMAQRGEGRRERGAPDGRGFGAVAFPLVRLVSHEPVQDELQLSDEQRKEIADLADTWRGQFRSVLGNGGQYQAMRDLDKRIGSELTKILDEDQDKRLTQISVQAYGASALLMHPTLAGHLNVTDEQKRELAEAYIQYHQGVRETLRTARDQDLSREERRGKFQELRTEASRKMLAVLTAEQREKLESLKGDKADIDLSQLWRWGGRGGRSFRGERDRDRGPEQADENRSDSNN